MRRYLDANVIIYAVEGEDDGLRTAARAWLVEGSKSVAEFRTSVFTESRRSAISSSPTRRGHE